MNPKPINWKAGATRHVIYALIAIAVIVPLLKKWPSSFTATPGPRRVYNFIEKLEPGSHVLLAFDYSPDSKAELYPMSVSLLDHCFRKGLIPIAMTHWPQGVGMARRAFDEVAAKHDKVAGEDYAVLGFKPGYVNLIINMGENLKSAFPEDLDGRSTETMPALEGVETLRDIDLAVDLAAGATVDAWVMYGSDRYDFPLVAAPTAVATPRCYPFVQSKQLVGLLGGLRGAADYEQILNVPGKATELMPAQTVTHLLLIVLILGANVRFIVRKLRGTEDA